jgi:hypothetical protein
MMNPLVQIALSQDGNVTISVPAGVAEDLYGNPNMKALDMVSCANADFKQCIFVGLSWILLVR